jgi:hypothetical protein
MPTTPFRILLPAVAVGLVVLSTGCGGGADAANATTTAKVTTTTAKVVLASDIPVAHTPPGGFGDAFPAPVLATCSEPLVAGAPDLRGMWKAVAAERDGRPVPPDNKVYRHVERVEQCGDRLVVTGGGVIHDMRVDGTAANGVNDVLETDFRTPITVVATYEDGVHVLRPVGAPVQVTRKLDGDRMIWNYLGTRVTLERVGGPNDPPPAI